jgi:hypothetical protein
MANLFWKKDQEPLITLAADQFKTEDELESYLYKHPQLLGDLVIISRQTKTGNKRDIPDLIALDADNNVVIIELKRDTADENVIAQVLRYAIWAETNPDSIKNLWLECDHKPDGMVINWESLNIKIMIIAPTIPGPVLRLVNRITYSVELYEITRFLSGANEFVLVNPRQPETIPNVGVSKGQPVWDENWYRQRYDPASVDVFLSTVRRIEKIIKDKGWKLETRFNKDYVAFKYGFPNVFHLGWIGVKSFCVVFKVPKEIASAIHIEGIEPLRYAEEWNQVLYKVEGKDFPIEKLLPLFEESYRYVTGNKP